MERITERWCSGGIRIKGCATLYADQERKGAPASNAIVRLAAYEDAMPLERAQELAQAEKDGRLAVLPFVAMVEQSLKNGKMAPKRDQCFNGRYAVVYVDKKKWASPLIDICGGCYDREEAEKRLAELHREEAEAALKKREEEDNEVD